MISSINLLFPRRTGSISSINKAMTSTQHLLLATLSCTLPESSMTQSTALTFPSHMKVNVTRSPTAPAMRTVTSSSATCSAVTRLFDMGTHLLSSPCRRSSFPLKDEKRDGNSQFSSRNQTCRRHSIDWQHSDCAKHV